MDDDDDPLDRPDPLRQRCERAKAWTAGAVALVVLGVATHLDVVVGAALIGAIFWAGRWIHLAGQVRARDAEVAEGDDEDGDGDPEDGRPSNIIQFRRDP